MQENRNIAQAVRTMTADVRDLRDKLHGRASSALLPLGRTLARWGLSPNQITWAGVLLNIFAAALIVTDALAAAGIVWLFAGFLDLLDGAMARGQNKTSPLGAFLDSTTDRISDGVVFCALIYHFASLGEPLHAGVASLALLAALLTSYARARAKSLNADCRSGLITRAERIVLVGLGLCFDWLVGIIYVLAALGAYTVAQRLHDVRRQLDDAG